ncbi:MAG: phosphoribosylanthranilate isomerase [Glaciecola sp.]|jgi:phosphoribosylanthranilate isomerase
MKNDLSIKVCGLKDESNIKEIDGLGVDYIGMIFYAKSPRFAGNSSLKLDTIKAKKVGVFVNATYEYVKQIKKEFNIEVAQLHGSESPELCQQIKNLGLEIWKVFGIDDSFNFSILNDFSSVDLFLFDTKSPLHGGTGMKFDWRKLDELNGKFKFMLSGGIGKEDVDTINHLSIRGLIGIDLNSKFEITPGHKNVPMLEEFISKINK